MKDSLVVFNFVSFSSDSKWVVVDFFKSFSHFFRSFE